MQEIVHIVDFVSYEFLRSSLPFAMHCVCTELSTLDYRGADKSLARSGRKQATATEDFDIHIYYL